MSPLQNLDVARFPLSGSRLIEASAGTGKTWTLTALYLRLVLGHGGEAAFARELDPPEILVMSFTEAATQELRERIRRRLGEAATAFSQPAACDDDFLAQLRAAYAPEQWPGCARRLALAAEWMDEAAVSTIHAWCRRVLAEHAFDSGSPFALQLETDHSELQQEAVRDWWRSFMLPLPAVAVAEVRSWWSGPDELAKALQHVLKHVACLPPAEAPAGVLESALAERARRLAELKAPWADWVAELREIIEKGLADGVVHARKLQARYYENWLNELTVWAASEDCVELNIATGWTRLTRQGLAEAWKVGTPPDHPALQAIETLRDELAALPDARMDVLRHAAHWVAARVEAEKQRRAEIGFDGLLERLALALEGPNGTRLAARIRARYPVALIDEFQDTDPVQYRIFNAVYRLEEPAEGCALVLIGDPKQAIYAFRGADIHTYLVARRACAGRLYTLNRNFRSSQAMVEATNHCFGTAEKLPGAAFRFDRDAVPFLPAEAQGRDEELLLDGAPVPALTVWCNPPADNGRPRSRDTDREYIAAAHAASIRDLLAAGRAGRAGFAGEEGFRPLRPEHIAVLVGNRNEAGIMRAALAQRGVPSVYLSGRDSVFASAQAAELQLWLQACAEPDEARRVRSALATATLGLDWAELERLDSDERAWEETVLRFRGYRELWRRQGVLPMLRHLLHDHAVPARLLGAEGGERVLTDLLHLAELLQQASQRLEGEHALIRHLAVERSAAAGAEVASQTGGDAAQLRLESDADLVQIVTVHKSKGLEYPLVFLPFGAQAREGDKKGPVAWHDADGRLQVSLNGDEAAYEAAEDERLAEDVRKLYVALTRACHATWLGVAPANMLPHSALGHLLGGVSAEEAKDAQTVEARLQSCWGGCPHILAGVAPAGDAARLPAADAPDRPLAARRPSAAPREAWWIASYSALRTAGGTPDTPAEDVLREALAEAAAAIGVAEAPQTKPAPGSLHAFPRGAVAGSFLHDLLEWAAAEGFAAVAADAGRLRAEVERRAAPRGWAEQVELLTDWLQTLLKTPLPLPGGTQCALAELPRLSAELEFWLPAAAVDSRALDELVCRHTLAAAPRPALAPTTIAGMLKGFIDLVIEHEGRYYVIDYKSNWLGPDAAAYTPEAMRAAVLEARYELQYVLYVFALHRQLRARLPGYDYERHVGGAAYLFLRGIEAASRGMHLERPPRELIESLDALFAAREAA